MALRLSLVLLMACNFLRGFLCAVMEGPFDATVLYGTDHELNCKTEENDSPAWSEVFEESSPSRIFVLYDRQSTDDKYTNFNISGTVPVYNLEVKAIEIEDEGVYECSTTFVDGQRAMLSVEVPPSNVSINCNAATNCASPNEDISSEISCTCTAIGAYPETLVMRWTGATPTSAEPSISESNVGPNGSFDFTQTSEGAITGTSGSVQCTLENFVSDIEEDARTATYTYSSPVCELIVTHDQTCSGGTANLTCSCDGDSPKVNTYTFFDGNGDIIGGDTQDNVRLNVPIENDKKTVFYCRGCNGVNFGEQSLSKMTICEPGTGTLPPATTDTITGDDCPQRSSPALIAVCCVEGVVIIVIIFIFGVLYTIRKGSRKDAAQSLETHPYNGTDKTNTAYMDLQETKQLSFNHANVDIPFENLSLQSPFPGKGLMKYRKAQMTLTSKKEEIVVKTASDDAPVRLAKLQADEVRKLTTLASNVNVAQFLGRCNNVPNLLCYQFVNGTKLGEYLRENFQQSKIHQYGNTKQKRYLVPEKGSVESLPGVALQIARGMKYLSAQKFLHPGLRSEKIIFDVSGQCKLYDFVSEDNAKDIIAILWSKSVPYQWMPPEYLFLEKLGPLVDVWSFGILMWEIFSYGALPHEGKSRNDVEKEIRGKEKLPLPSNCPGAIWQITLNCWDQSPEKRPSFDHLSLQLSHMCNDSKEYDEIPSK